MFSQCLHLLCCLVYRILSCHCFIDFRFSLFFVCRVWCLVDFRFLSFRRFINRFASSFLTTVGWILLIESKPFDFAVSTPSLFVTWSIDAFAFYGLIDFRFFALLFICRIGCLIDFCFLSFGRFVYRFASSFLTTVGCTLLIASTPFVFVVSTPLLLLRSIAFLLSLLHRLSLFAFLRLSRLVFGRFPLLASAALSIAFCFVFLNNRWLDIVN